MVITNTSLLSDTRLALKGRMTSVCQSELTVTEGKRCEARQSDRDCTAGHKGWGDDKRLGNSPICLG